MTTKRVINEIKKAYRVNVSILSTLKLFFKLLYYTNYYYTIVPQLEASIIFQVEGCISSFTNLEFQRKTRMFKKIIASFFVLATTTVFGMSLSALNSASKAELMEINGIGEVKAAAIIKERRKGKFKSFADLEKVEGVGAQIAANAKNDVKSASDVKKVSKKTKTKASKTKSKSTKEKADKKTKKTKAKKEKTTKKRKIKSMDDKKKELKTKAKKTKAKKTKTKKTKAKKTKKTKSKTKK